MHRSVELPESSLWYLCALLLEWYRTVKPPGSYHTVKHLEWWENQCLLHRSVELPESSLCALLPEWYRTVKPPGWYRTVKLLEWYRTVKPPGW